MSVFKYFKRKAGSSISMQTFKNLQKKLTMDLNNLWVKLHLMDEEKNPTKSTIKDAKKLYYEIVRKESLVTLMKIITQQINLGFQTPVTNDEELLELNTNYNNIFKLGMYKARREELIILAERTSGALPLKFVNKELAYLNKIIDRTQYKINAFNAEVAINLEEISPAIESEYYRMVA